jgi:hypothetical protein
MPPSAGQRRRRGTRWTAAKPLPHHHRPARSLPPPRAASRSRRWSRRIQQPPPPSIAGGRGGRSHRRSSRVSALNAVRVKCNSHRPNHHRGSLPPATPRARLAPGPAATVGTDGSGGGGEAMGGGLAALGLRPLASPCRVRYVVFPGLVPSR